MDIQSLISQHLVGLEAYRPPEWETLAARAGLEVEDLVRLGANENPYGPSPSVARALAQFQGFQFYPDYGALTKAVARYAGVDADCIVLGHGGDEIITLLVQTFVEPGEAAILCPPAFGMYPVAILSNRGRVINVPRHADFGLDVEGIEAAVQQAPNDQRPKLLFLTSPGNPDGQTIPHDVIRRLLALPVAVLVDEAYIEFGGETVVPLLKDHPNLIILRTFSKWAGMAGLRLGYAITSPEIAAAMARLRPPYNINAAAVVAALASFQDMDRIQEHIAHIIEERDWLQSALAALPGITPIPSQANFLLCQLDGRDGREIADALAAEGILVRTYSEPSLVQAIRISAGRPDQNDRLVAALGRLLGADPATLPAPRQARARRRQGSIQRQTHETAVTVALALDGTGVYQVDTGLGFLDHMLDQVAAHGLFDLTVRARGDLQVDEHHTVEDVAIGLGQALDAALGDRRGLVRMGNAYAPLDEALAHVVVDLSGRPYAVIEADLESPRIGAVDADLLIHFLETLATHARISLHARVLYGRNDHHKAEALFKALGRALDAATREDPRRLGVPSTKGVL